jgi:hypothetical protein
MPSVYRIGGVIHYERPDGSRSPEDPFEGADEKHA